ncbi:ankyrin repeat-containing domain protein [Cadophora sp. MPI-SDFR-AT-0126]|nr:ankyrin repeat-containing domain protein [Leotiomycetes sp. MPI-SDFR-AT-0126]
MSDTTSNSDSASASEGFEMVDAEDATDFSGHITKLQSWLQPTDYMADSSEFRRHLSSQAPGTGLWLCETSRFQQWQESDVHGMLWIKGVPGAGKSVMAASLIEYLRTREEVPVLFFFFRHIIAANRKPRDLVRDFLAQLLPHSSRLQSVLHPLSENESKLEDVSDENLSEHLLLGLSSVEKAYCVVDAMDEMELGPKDGFLRHLNSLATFRPDSVKVLMASRPKQYLQSGLKDASIVHIGLEDDLVGKDIGVVVSHRLKIVLSDEQTQLQESLTSIICERSKGLFLYARLLVDQIIPTIESGNLDVEQLANTLPVGLEEMYDSMLFKQSKVLGVDQNIQVFLLQAVTHSSRALRLNELASALSCAFPRIEPATAKTLTRDACSPLLEILEDETIQVIHHSFTEYLLNKERHSPSKKGSPSHRFPALDPQEVHRILAILCMRYINAGALPERDVQSTQWRSDWSHYQGLKLEYPFLEYSVKNWAYHCRRYDVEDIQFFQAIAQFVKSDNPHFRQWAKLEWTEKSYPLAFKVPSPLHIAAFAGMTKYAKMLLDQGHSVDALDGDEKTPLHWACERGHLDMVALLLENHAEPNPEDYRGNKPIHGAAKRDHAEVGYRHTILEMLPYLEGNGLEELLCRCCLYGKSDLVRLILDTSSVTPNAKFWGATAIYISAKGLHLDCVEQLLAHGANVHIGSEWRPLNRLIEEVVIATTPLHGLLTGMNFKYSMVGEQILELLVKAGDNLEALNLQKDTVLSSLFHPKRKADQEVVRILLEAGSNPSATLANGDTIIHQYLRHCRNVDIFELLLKYGASVDDRGIYGNTLLHTFTHSRDTDFLRLLIAHGARSDVKNDKGISALEESLSKRSTLEVVRLLLGAASDIGARRLCIWTLPTSEDTSETIQFIEELLATGVTLEDADALGKTPLLSNVSSQQAFDALIQCGARLDATDRRGRGVLHYFMADGNKMLSIERFQNFVAMGLDPKKVDIDGNNLLHEVALKYGSASDLSFIQYLHSCGIPADSTNNKGLTPAHINMEANGVEFIRETPMWKLFNDADKAFNINITDLEGVTLLHLACIRSEVDVIRLLDAGADPYMTRGLIDQADAYGRTPLHDACASGHPESVHLLLKAGARVNQEDDCKRTPLHCCADSVNEQKIFSVVGNYNSASSRTIKDRWRPYCTGPRRKYMQINRIEMVVTALLAAGADPLALDEDDNYPLERAITSGCSEMARKLEFTVEAIREAQDDDFDPLIPTQLALTKPPGIHSLDLKDNIRQDLMRNSAHYLPLLDPQSIVDFLSQHAGDITGVIHTSTEVEEEDIYDETSLLYALIDHGFTDIVASLGDMTRINDDIQAVQARNADGLDALGYYPFIKRMTPSLHIAVRRQFPSLEMLHTLVDKCGVNVNARMIVRTPRLVLTGGSTALHILAKGASYWHLDAIRFLVSRGASVDSVNENGESPLHISSSRLSNPVWRSDCIRLLLDLGSDPNFMDSRGLTCLHKAVDFPEVMKLLMERGSKVSAGNVSPLFSAVQAKNFEAFQMLLDAGADPNSKDSTNVLERCFDAKYSAGRWILQSAIHSDAQFIKLLIERGADIYAILDNQETLVHHIFSKASYHVVATFLAYKEKLEFNKKDRSGRTTLLAACDWAEHLPGYKSLEEQPKAIAPIQLLLEAGAHPLAIDNEGRNALHHLLDNAAIEEDTVLNFLRLPAAKTLVHHKDNKGCSPFHRALLNFRPNICEALVSLGADLYEPNPTGATALHVIANQSLEFIDEEEPEYYDLKPSFYPNYYPGLLRFWNLFLAGGGSINVRDGDGNTPLHTYLSAPVPWNNDEGVCYHAEHIDEYFGGVYKEEVDWCARTGKGENALQIIAQEEYANDEAYGAKLFGLLVRKGVDPLEEDGKGRSALDVAAAFGRKGILELFAVGK